MVRLEVGFCALWTLLGINYAEPLEKAHSETGRER